MLRTYVRDLWVPQAARCGGFFEDGSRSRRTSAHGGGAREEQQSAHGDGARERRTATAHGLRDLYTSHVTPIQQQSFTADNNNHECG